MCAPARMAGSGRRSCLYEQGGSAQTEAQQQNPARAIIFGKCACKLGRIGWARMWRSRTALGMQDNTGQAFIVRQRLIQHTTVRVSREEDKVAGQEVGNSNIGSAGLMKFDGWPGGGEAVREDWVCGAVQPATANEINSYLNHTWL